MADQNEHEERAKKLQVEAARTNSEAAHERVRAAEEEAKGADADLNEKKKESES